jgi:phenylalanyl-tRNA synthetase beta chain
MAHVYLPQSPGQLPLEERMVSLTTGGDYWAAKGVVESVLAALEPRAVVEARPTRQELLDADRSAELRVRVPGGEDRLLGYVGEVTDAGRARFDLRGPTTVAELRVATLGEIADLVPQYRQPPVFPAVSRDLNLVVDESVEWADLAQTVATAAAPHVEDLKFQDVYRDAERLGPGKKSLLMTLTLRSADGTLTNEQADALRARVVAACEQAHAAQLRA